MKVYMHAISQSLWHKPVIMSPQQLTSSNSQQFETNDIQRRVPLGFPEGGNGLDEDEEDEDEDDEEDSNEEEEEEEGSES